MAFGRAVALIGLVLTVVGACELAQDGDRPVGDRCTADGQCRSGLHCVYGRCRHPCTTDRDCGIGAVCVPSDDDPGLYVCTLADEGSGSDCPEGLGDDGEGKCRRPCQHDGPLPDTPCGPSQTCDQGWCRIAGLTWVTIPGRAFDMGSNAGEGDERPIHPVTVPPFEMLQTEVTVSQYRECLTAGACSEPGTGAAANWNDPGYEDHPVNYVNWQQAVDFCTWVGGRLPSEAEWEYAARSGGLDRTYAWGDDPVTCVYAAMQHGGNGCGTGRTWAVCAKEAGNTEHGLCDMAGNLWEWVQDWYHANYTDAPADGSAWVDPPGTKRVARGGSFTDDAVTTLRAANRVDFGPNSRTNYIGARCARDAPQ